MTPANWIEDAQCKMSALGWSADLYITKAAMLGGAIRPFEGSLIYDPAGANTRARYVITSPHDSSGILGSTPEMTAFRWMEKFYPEALIR